MTSVDASDDAVWAAVLPTIIEIYPEVADLKIVARVVRTHTCVCELMRTRKQHRKRALGARMRAHRNSRA
jgi:hypothetical protein